MRGTLDDMSLAIDTLAYARLLREAGLTEQQADGQARALAAAMTDSLATKQDLRETEGRIDVRFAHVDARFVQIDERFKQIDERFRQVDARFDHLERHVDMRLAEMEKRMEMRFQQVDLRFAAQDARLEGRLADLERRMTVRLGGITVAGIGVVSALVKML